MLQITLLFTNRVYKPVIDIFDFFSVSFALKRFRLSENAFSNIAVIEGIFL